MTNSAVRWFVQSTTRIRISPSRFKFMPHAVKATLLDCLTKEPVAHIKRTLIHTIGQLAGVSSATAEVWARAYSRAPAHQGAPWGNRTYNGQGDCRRRVLQVLRRSRIAGLVAEAELLSGGGSLRELTRLSSVDGDGVGVGSFYPTTTFFEKGCKDSLTTKLPEHCSPAAS